MMNHQTPESMLPLTPAVFHILLALADRERHGYGIKQEVSRLTYDKVKLGPGTLYGTIKRMVAAGLLEESTRQQKAGSQPKRRRYYRATEFGKRVAVAESERLQVLVSGARAKKLLWQTKDLES